MDDDFDSSRRSRNPYRFDPKLGPLSEQKRASDWNEEQVKLCIDELRVPGRNDNRFSSCSEGDKQLCAIPQRRLSVEMELFFWEDDGETKEAEADDDDEDDASQASMETSEGSYYAYDSIEMGFDDEEDEYEIPMKSGDDRPHYEGRARRNYRRRCRSTSSVCSSLSSCSIASNERRFGFHRISYP